MDGCERRDVASEQQLIQAWADGCSLIHCLYTTTMSPEFFFALTEPLATNITLTGTLVLDWISDLEDLQAVRHAFNNGTVDQSASRQLLPIRYNNWLKMSGLQLVGWPTSMGVFMEMLTALPPGPGMLLLENTTWTVLDCTHHTSMLSYLAFPASVRPDVYPDSTASSEIEQFEWDPATFTMTIPALAPLPLRATQVAANNWTSQHTVGLANFSIACRSSTDYQHMNLEPEQPSDPFRCLSRRVSTSAELAQARLDDCRHVLALPANAGNRSGSALQAAPLLSQDWLQWDRNFSVHTTISGVVQLDVIRAPNVAPITHPIDRSAVLELWHLDYLGSVPEVVAFAERLRLFGVGQLAINNVRYIVTGCNVLFMPIVESMVLSLLTFSTGQGGAVDVVVYTNDVTIDRDQGLFHFSTFSGHYRGGLGLFKLFGQEVTWNVTNTTVMCVAEWDIQDSVDKAMAIADVLPPSLQPEALRSGCNSVRISGGNCSGGAAPAASQPPGCCSSGPDVAAQVIAGVAAALAASLALAWLVFTLWRRRGRARGQNGVQNPSVEAVEAGTVSGAGSGDVAREAVSAVAASAPAALLMKDGHRQRLLASEMCVQMLADHLRSQSEPLPWPSVGLPISSGSRPTASRPTSAGQRSCASSMHHHLRWADEEGYEASWHSSATADVLLHCSLPPEPVSVSLSSSSGQEDSKSTTATDAGESLAHGSVGRPTSGDPAGGAERAQQIMQDLMVKVFPQRPDVDLQVDLQRDVKLGRVLGEGGYGVVHEGWWRHGTAQERHVAVKVLDMDAIGSAQEKQRFLRAFSRELDTLSRINHPSIVHCFGGCVTDTSVCVLLEYLPAGNLAQYVHGERADNPLSLDEMLAVSLQLASALAHLHPVVFHGDVKPENCLLTEEGHVKLSDFGMSKFKWQSAVRLSSVHGTLPYTAPEMLRGEPVNEKCDVYSLAVLLWECCTGEQPWRNTGNPVQLYKLVMDEGKRLTLPETCNPELAALIGRCWHQKPEMRPSAAEVVRKVDLMLAMLEGDGGRGESVTVDGDGASESVNAMSMAGS